MKKITLLFTLFVLIFTACKKSETEKEEQVKQKRVVLSYFFGDISLWDALHESVNQMEKNAPSKDEGTMLVYLDWSPSVTQFRSPVLLEICKDSTNSIKSRVVKTYPKDQDAGDPAVFASVLNDLTLEYPADSYGLIVAGHGNGWVSANTPEGRSIGGSDRINGKYLDIDQLAAAIPASLHFDFIAFHSCLMSEAAALYELKDKCDYMVSSVEALPGCAYPYDLAAQYLFTQPHADLYNFIKTTTEFYEKDIIKNQIDLFTIGLYRMDKMENLTKVVKKCMDVMPLSYNEMHETIFSRISLCDSLFMYPWPKGVPFSATKHHFYDLALLTDIMIDINAPLSVELDAAINNVAKIKVSVLGKRHEAKLSQIYETYQTKTAGMSFYIPNKNVNSVSDKVFYDRFAWSKASGFTPEKDR